MAEPSAAPHAEVDPATTSTTGAQHENVVVKYPADPNAEPQSDAEESEDEAFQPDEIQADEDLLDDMPEEEDEIELVHCKIADMSKLRLERFKQMKVLRS
jgi:protein phosphatase 1 regulatory subunit 7